MLLEKVQCVLLGFIDLRGRRKQVEGIQALLFEEVGQYFVCIATCRLKIGL